MDRRQRQRFGSDVVVDFLIERQVPYLPIMPGASFRGLHDSLVNTPGAPRIILCPHEKQALNVAHGFSKATGQVGVAAVHDVVGLLHGSMGVFSAFHDRVPLLLLGGAGPMNTTRRRPWIDWVHTANVQGNAVRDFTKFDDQPAAIEAIPDSLVRAWRVARTEPAGPVYVALDADLQEGEIEGEVPHYDPARVGPATPFGPAESALEPIVRLLLEAERPVIVAGYAGRDDAAFTQIPALAELLGAGMVDTGHRLNVPSRHRLNATGTAALEDADVILLLDVKDPAKALAREQVHERGVRLGIAPGTRIIEIGFGDLHVRSWVLDAGGILETDQRLAADTRAALPVLEARVRAELASEAGERAARREARRLDLARRHEHQWAEWEAEADEAGTTSPVATAWLARETRAAIAGSDWVLAGGSANHWATRLWDFDRPYRHAGLRIDTATQIAMTVGVALAHRDAGRLVVNIQPDGDLMFDVSALWIAAAERIPLLVVMYNNRAYFNDFGHQARMAEQRGSDPALVPFGIAINPTPDYARIAEGFGWHAEGPIDDPSRVRDAVARAAEIVLRERRPALVDVVTQPR
jgi:benzoylformate decarboxylase/acetolactate synthase-1/2/3 large subunit